MEQFKNILVVVLGKVFAKRVCRAAHYVEHAGFVGLAGASIYDIVWMLYWISVLLLISGVFSLVYDKLDNV